MQQFLTVIGLMSCLSFAVKANAKKPHPSMQGIFKQLNLTEEQQNQLKEYRQSMKDKHKLLRKQTRELRKQIKIGFKSDMTDSELLSLHQKLQDRRTQMADLRFNKMLNIRKILNKEQRSKFQELKEKQRKRRFGKRHKRVN